MMDFLQTARDKGNEFKRQYILNNCINFVSTLSILNKTSLEVLNLTVSKKLISLNYTNSDNKIDRFAYPKFQFVLNDYVKQLEVIEPFFVSPWDLVMFLESGDYYLSGQRPIDVLIKDDLDSVLNAASNYGEQRPV